MCLYGVVIGGWCCCLILVLVDVVVGVIIDLIGCVMCGWLFVFLGSGEIFVFCCFI